MAERMLRLAGVLALLPGLVFAQDSGPLADTRDPPEDLVRADARVLRGPNDKIGDEAAHEQSRSQEERVRLISQTGRFDCSDAATRTAAADGLYDATDGWLPPAALFGYRPLAVIGRTPVADYPRELLEASKPGAVGLLLFIDEKGDVARVEAVCATDPAFIPSAVRVARDNRYRPSTLHDTPIRDLAYQIVGYGVAGD